VSPDGQTIACAGVDGQVHFWDLKSGATKVSLATTDSGGPSPAPSALASIAYSPHGEYLSTAAERGPVRFWHLGTKRQLWQLPAKGCLVSYSPSGKALAVYGSNKSKVLLVAVTYVNKAFQFSHKSVIHRVAFSTHGKSLACAGNDGTVALWDKSTGQPSQE